MIADVDPEFRSDANVLNNFYLRSNSGGMVPLNAVVEMKEQALPVSMNHYDQLPAVILSFNLAPGASLGSVTSEVSATAKKILPENF